MPAASITLDEAVDLVSRWLLGRAPALGHQARDTGLETAYCAEVLATTYQAMGLLPSSHRPGWYDAGRFWSGDHLGLSAGYRLGGEIAAVVPAGEPGVPQPPAADGRASRLRRRRPISRALDGIPRPPGA